MTRHPIRGASLRCSSLAYSRTRRSSRLALLAARVSGLLLLAVLAACSGGPPDAAIRDFRPLQIERDDKVIVEASGDLFTVGAPTTVTFDKIKSGAVPLTVPGRAVARSRVLFDADRALERAIALQGGHLVVKTGITVEQTVEGQKKEFKSAASNPFEVDLFPHSLHKVAQKLADRASRAAGLWTWLGLTVEAAPGGLLVKDVVTKFDHEGFFSRFDAPPLDGKVTAAEARIGQPGGMTEGEFARLDHDGDQVIADYEIVEEPVSDGIAASAGLARGDLIVSVDGKAMASADEMAGLWKGSGGEIILQVGVQRGGKPATIGLPRFGRPTEIPIWLIFGLCMAAAATLIALPVPVIGGLIVVWERKISAWMQSRVGPNRVGPNGWLQWLADGLKLIMKEDLVPAAADPYLFKASPYLAFIGLFLVFMVLPFTGWFIVADLNIGLLFILSVTSLMVVSIIMGGWSSNSKWSLLGGMRSAAQIISYELPASVALLGIAALAGSLSTETIVGSQGGAPWNWFIFRNPFTFIAFFIYFISALAEGNRTPFDLPEAESELVSGYNTEYSGFRFSLFPLVEWVNLFVIGAVAGTLFLGGWRIPGVSLASQDASGWLQLAGFLVFLFKILTIVFVIIWIRWTLPRFRVDQMMNLCWKFFIPISFALFIGTLVFIWLLPPWLDMAVRIVTFLVGGCAPTYIFIKKVQYNRSRYQELRLNPLL
ncbi:MAG: NADH-quinone oxidoreductase subunit NuoH [Myxococcales bacterium]|nr:NADH-quinone oxidoreductase subunit NuoH [Myxococcales bacterium]